MLFSMEECLGSHFELKNMNKIHTKPFKKHDYYSSNRYSSDSNYPLFIEGEWYEIRHPNEQKNTDKLYHVVASNIKDKGQCNDAIEYEPKFHDKSSLSSGTKDTLSVVTFRLRGGKNIGQQ